MTNVELLETILALDGCGLTVTDQEDLAVELQTGLETCGSCNAHLGPLEAEDWFPWHWPWEDCRAVREPEEVAA